MKVYSIHVHVQVWYVSFEIKSAENIKKKNRSFLGCNMIAYLTYLT